MTRLLRFFRCSLLGILLHIGSAYAQVAPGPSLYNPNSWIGQQSSPPCALTNGSVISVNALSCVNSPGGDGVDLNTITLTQNSTFAFPTGLPVNGNFQFGFRINHGIGPYTAKFAAGYQFPNTVLTNGQPTLSTSGTDYVWCVSEEGSPPTVVDCNPAMLAMTGVVPFAITNASAGTDCGSAATCASTSITAALNDIFIAGPAFCDTACNSGTPAGTAISSVAQTSGSGTLSACSLLTGTKGANTAGLKETSALYACKVTVGGSIVVTATMAGTVAHLQVPVFSVSGIVGSSFDDGKGNTQLNATGASSYNVSTSATISQSGEFVISYIAGAGGSGAPGLSSGYTSILSATAGLNILMQWEVSGASGTSPSATGTLAGAAVADIATLKHP